MWFGVLGSLTAGQPPRPVEGRAERRVLAALLLDAGRLVTADRLMDAVWGEAPPRTAHASLQVRVSNLRRAVGRDRIISESSGYRLVVGDDDVDAGVFERLLSEGRHHLAAGQPERAHHRLTEALRLWRGPAYADVAYEPFAADEAARLERLRCLARDDDVEARLGLGLTAEVAAELEDAVTSDPTDERRWSQLMRALYCCGRQADALRAFRRLSTQLRDIGLDPSPELRALEHAILVQDPTLSQVRPVTVRGPSWDDALIGRADILTRLENLLRAGALVTLTGTGGVGKTALAYAAIDRVRTSCDLPTTFVALDGVRDAADVAAVVLAAVHGVEEPGGSLVDRIVGRLIIEPRLLVLDNAEHVASAVTEIGRRIAVEALETCLLVTSREPLALDHEVVLEVECLAVPADADTGDAIVSAPAVQLFLRRAGQARPEFVANETELSAVARICRQLDGLPLAVELAASRLGVLSTGEIEQRLSDRFRLLGTGRHDERRHDSLRAVIAWSFDTLDDIEQAALRRFSVFAGGASLAALEDVCGAEPVGSDGVLDTLTRLARKSLVVVDRTGPATRYSLLESIRAYATRALEAAGDAAPTRRRHLQWAVDLAHTIEDNMNGPHEATWCAVGRLEHANFLEALHTGSTTATCDALFVELAGRLRQFWEAAGLLTEAEGWLQRALDIKRPADVHRVRALLGAGRLADRRGDWARAERRYREGLELARQLNAPQWEANALNNLSYVSYARGDNDGSMDLADRALAIARRTDDHINQGRALTMSALIAQSCGDLHTARRHHLDALDVCGPDTSPALAAQSLANLGDVTFRLGDVRAALDWNEQSLAIARELDDRQLLAIALVNAAENNVELGELSTATALLDEALGITRTLSMPMIELAALACRARALMMQGESGAAIDAARQSTDAVLRYGVPHVVVDTLIQNANTVMPLGESELATKWLRHANAVAAAAGQTSECARIESILSQLT